jgi:hypothetical protein
LNRRHVTSGIGLVDAWCFSTAINLAALSL